MAARNRMSPPMGPKARKPGAHSKGGKLSRGKKYSCGGKLKK